MEAKAGWLEVAVTDGLTIAEPHSHTKYSGNFALRMPKSLHRWIVEAAEREGVSANQFVTHLLSMAKGKKNL